MSALRSILFALFQLVVTPIYAVLVLLAFWVPPLPRFRFVTGWCWINLLAARWLCGIRHRVIGAENIPPRATPHIVMSKHSSTWETLALNFLFPPLAFVAKRTALDPVLRLGLHPRLADHHRPQAGEGSMRRSRRPRATRQSFWIVVTQGNAHSRRTRAHYKRGGAPGRRS
jgi:1-acyl-sn-glycerol-3-phosphate acyltransferase